MGNKLYKHRNGTVYEVLSFKGKLEADWSDAVIYRKHDDPDSEVVARSTQEFFDGRFTPVGETSDPVIFDPVRDMVDFHQLFDLGYDGVPRALPDDLADFRYKFLGEELREYRLAQEAAYDETTRAPQTRDVANYTFHLDKALDGLVDLVYVALGTSYLHGFNFKEAWRRVHQANMKKVRRIRDDGAQDSGRAPTYDVVKPTGWKAPSHVDLVEVNDCLEPHGDRA